MSIIKKSILLLFLTVTFSGFSQHWLTSFPEAKTISKETQKPIILVFSGSDWCAPCIKLNKEIFSTSVFKSYAEGHFIMLKADFPRRKKNALDDALQSHNNDLAERYNPNGFFPLVLVLDNNGKVLGQTGYKKTSPNNFIKILESYSK